MMDRKMTRPFSTRFLPDVVTFLERHFGFAVEFGDPDGMEIEIDGRDLSGAEITEALNLYSTAIRDQMLRRQHESMRVCIGGPLNGQPHAWCGGPRHAIAVRIGPRRWAAYEIGDDHLRAWFRGYATSEKKARQLQIEKGKFEKGK
jgi:hypothetical protein